LPYLPWQPRRQDNSQEVQPQATEQVGQAWRPSTQEKVRLTRTRTMRKTLENVHKGDMSDKEIKLFIANSSWTVAKRMPETPHEYTTRRNAEDVAMFDRFILHIRSNGYCQRFGKYKYTYLDVDGWQYWTMGAPLKATVLINRARLKV
jgi:hypothetical protein